MKFNPALFTVFLAAIIPVLIIALAIYWDRRQRKFTEKPPQAEKLLRPPGYSLSLHLEKTTDKCVDLILTAMVASAFCGAGVTIFAILLGAHAPISYLIISFLIAGLFGGISIWVSLRAFNCYSKARNIRLGISGEQAVAESLYEASGFRVFHDLPGGSNWNIDHVAVGTRGVFLIETKARRRRKSRNGQYAHEVVYDGKALQFPFGNDTESIEQAKRSAKWLANYLNKRTGEPVEVFPIVVLPGWFVKISERGNFLVWVMNATYLPKFLDNQNERVEPAQVRRIIAAIDDKCRDIQF